MAMVIDNKIISLLWKECVIGLAEVDKEGRFLAVNKSFCELIEYTESELLTRNFKQITHPDDVDDDILMHSKLLSKELSSYRMFKRYITKSGRIIAVKLTVIPVWDDQGNFRLFLSQVAPASYGVSRETIQSNSKYIKTFLKNNWKWIVSGIIPAIGGLLYYFLGQHMAVSDLQHHVEAINDKLEVMTSLLRALKN